MQQMPAANGLVIGQPLGERSWVVGLFFTDGAPLVVPIEPELRFGTGSGFRNGRVGGRTPCRIELRCGVLPCASCESCATSLLLRSLRNLRNGLPRRKRGNEAQVELRKAAIIPSRPAKLRAGARRRSPRRPRKQPTTHDRPGCRRLSSRSCGPGSGLAPACTGRTVQYGRGAIFR